MVLTLLLVILLCFGWGAACAAIIPNRYVSLIASIVGGFLIGFYLPSLLGVV